MAMIVLLHKKHIENDVWPEKQGDFAVIDYYWVARMIKGLQDNVEATPRQQDKSRNTSATS